MRVNCGLVVFSAILDMVMSEVGMGFEEKLNKVIDCLTGRISTLEVDMKTCNDGREKANDRLEALETWKKTVVTSLGALQTQVKKLDESKDKNTKELVILNSAKDTIKENISQITTQVSSIKVNLAEVQEDTVQLNESLTEFHDSSTEWRHRYANYYPQGPQENVQLTQVLMGGWKQCFSQTYGKSMKDKFNQIRDELCTGSKILMACSRQDAESSGVISLLAAAPRQDVFKVTNTKYRGTNGTDSNGSKWYASFGEDDSQHSWGFAPSGQQIDLASCDRESGSKRLCWHLSDHGWRCGEENSNYEKWEKIIFTRD